MDSTTFDTQAPFEDIFGSDDDMFGDDSDKEEDPPQVKGIPIKESPFERAPEELVKQNYSGVKWMGKKFEIADKNGKCTTYEIQWPGNPLPRGSSIKDATMKNVMFARPIEKNGEFGEDNKMICAVYIKGDEKPTVITPKFYKKLYKYVYDLISQAIRDKKELVIPGVDEFGYISINFERELREEEKKKNCDVSLVCYDIPYALPYYWNVLINVYKQKKAEWNKTTAPVEKTQRASQKAATVASEAWKGNKDDYKETKVEKKPVADKPKTVIDELKNINSDDDEEEDDEDYNSDMDKNEDEDEGANDENNEEEEADNFIENVKMNVSISESMKQFSDHYKLPDSRHKKRTNRETEIDDDIEIEVDKPPKKSKAKSKPKPAPVEKEQLKKTKKVEEKKPEPKKVSKRKKKETEEEKPEPKKVSSKRKKDEVEEKPEPKKSSNKKKREEVEEEKPEPKKVSNKRKRIEEIEEEDTETEAEVEDKTEGFNKEKQKRNTAFLKFMRQTVIDYKKSHNGELFPDVFKSVNVEALSNPKTDEEKKHKAQFGLLICYLSHYAPPSSGLNILPKPATPQKKKAKVDPLDIGVDWG